MGIQNQMNQLPELSRVATVALICTLSMSHKRVANQKEWQRVSQMKLIECHLLYFGLIEIRRAGQQRT